MGGVGSCGGWGGGDGGGGGGHKRQMGMAYSKVDL